MEKTVYIDLLFLINFSMDFLCFYISARIISAKFSTLRAVAAAVIGGIYGGFALFVSANPVLSVVFDVLVCLFMCAIVFGRKQNLIFSTLVYFSVSMALGGFMTALFNLLNRMGFSKLVADETEGDGISVWLFALLAAVSAVFTLMGGRSFRRRSAARSAEVSVVYGKHKKKLSAMVDSGNLLREPISGRACIAVDIDALLGVVPDGILSVAREEKIEDLGSIGAPYMKNVRLVPTHTASGEKILIGIRADSILIDAGKGAYATDAFLVLSKLREGAGVDALVPSELIN